MSYLVAHLSDPHLHNFTAYSSVNESGVNSRLLAGISAVERAVDAAVERGARAVVVSGDVFHVGSRYLTSGLSPVAAMFQRLSAKPLTYHIAAGNHDMASLDGKMHALEFLKGYRNFNVYDAASTVSIGPRHVDFVPFHRDPKALEEALGSLRGDHKADVLVIHAGIDAAQMGSEEVVDHGAVGPALFEGWELVLAGHYHGYQCGQYSGGEWVIPGSLLQVGASEEGQRKGFVLVDYETMDREFVEVESPRFVTLRLPADLKRLDELKANPARYLRLLGETSDLDRPDVVRLMQGAEALWTFEPAAQSSEGPRLAIGLDTSPAAVLSKYVDHRKPEGYDLDRLKQVGASFLE